MIIFSSKNFRKVQLIKLNSAAKCCKNLGLFFVFFCILLFFITFHYFFRNIMDVVNNLSEPADEIVILKLDILIAISYLYGQYYDVSDGYLGIFAKVGLKKLNFK